MTELTAFKKVEWKIIWVDESALFPLRQLQKVWIKRNTDLMKEHESYTTRLSLICEIYQ